MRQVMSKLQLKKLSLAYSHRKRSSTVPAGYLPLYVGEEKEKFVVNAKLLSHPIFVKLLDKSAHEYGYKQEGVLRIPCQVILFKRILESLSGGDEFISCSMNYSLGARA